ncbi:DNA-binding transcriptional regulator, MarR family [Agromyces sp. CF514]|uniref:MarR family winged helix-turn-helix transcriptional regulator n=1 Tax=Agromyces sp. CF514 TaxID=1881031 RepID=UPI0008E01D9D|nr:MarR family transcriptional regulator [Agromyces sp. CF514]SFR79438.1 DNA-binding transcriptional regulator, MarR family [Agromyces sp. CF514]
MDQSAESKQSSGYWYPSGHAAENVDVLNLLRRYRNAEAAMRVRTRADMGMGETDLLALRYLLRAQREGRPMVQRDLANLLGISAASTTALVDRLAKSGHVAREPHPTDGRAVIVVPTVDTDQEVRATLGAMHRRMIAVVDELEPEEISTIARFLTGMLVAVEDHDDVEPLPAPAEGSHTPTE